MSVTGDLNLKNEKLSRTRSPKVKAPAGGKTRVKNIVLIGFMGTGKTEAGRYLAHELGLSFEDTDDQVQRLARMSIPAIFDTFGENHFRKLEKKVVTDLSQKDSQIIATGGGVVKDPANIQALKENGIIFSLDADTGTIKKRTAGSGRPLLKGPDFSFEIDRLKRERDSLYEISDHRVDTTRRDPSEVGRLIKAVLEAKDSIKVNLGDRSYSIRIESGGLERIGEKLKSLRLEGKIGVITNPKVDRLYGMKVLKSLRKEGYRVSKIVIPDGERHKNLKTLNRIYNELLKEGFDRHSTLVALGGGVIGDITGFAAATFMRGIGYIQVPTTLVAQVDASIGGKTAVDHPFGKNLIGAFHQPRLVFIDPEVLKTLPRREFISGLAEVVKYGMIRDEGFFSYLEDNIEKIKKLEPSPLSHVIWKSCSIKAEVVEKDEREGDLRKILNYGHTLGHALETLTGYRSLLHGEAVGMGMVYAARLAVSLGIFSLEGADRQTALLGKIGLPTALPKLKPSDIFKIMSHDKKTALGMIHFVLPDRIGKVTVKPVEKSDILKTFSQIKGSGKTPDPKGKRVNRLKRGGRRG